MVSNAISNVISNVFVSIISELIKEKGTAGGTSSYDNRPKAYAFINGTSTVWCNEAYQYPASVWMRFRKPHRLQKIGYRSLNRDNNAFEVIASDDCTSWTTLLSVGNPGFTKDSEFKQWSIAIKNIAPFSCIGLKWHKSNTHVCVNGVTMWEPI